MKKRIYVAGPLETSGSLWKNVRKACSVADMLVRFGAIPIVPHLSVLWAFSTPTAASRSREEWMEICFGLLEGCDAIYRYEGESVGADEEVEYAMSVLKIPVMTDPYGAAELLGYELDES